MSPLRVLAHRLDVEIEMYQMGATAACVASMRSAMPVSPRETRDESQDAVEEYVRASAVESSGVQSDSKMRRRYPAGSSPASAPWREGCEGCEVLGESLDGCANDLQKACEAYAIRNQKIRRIFSASEYV